MEIGYTIGSQWKDYKCDDVIIAGVISHKRLTITPYPVQDSDDVTMTLQMARLELDNDDVTMKTLRWTLPQRKG